MRLWHSWDKWEDYKHNFYGGSVEYEHDKTLELYANLLRDLGRFEEALKTITKTWKYSCEHNLTNEGMNRVAYLGQASCALIYNVPHSVCMGGYNLLTEKEKVSADAMAKKYLNLWLEENKHVYSEKI